MSALDRKLVRGSAWLALSYGGSQFISLVVTAVLAHLIKPADFGLVALASIVLLAIGMIQESGLSLAVIQRRTDVEEAAGSAYAFTIAASVVLCGITIFAAPLAAHAFHQPRLTDVVRALALLLPLRAVGGVPAALIEREFAFGLRARSELAGVAAQAAVSISVAALGGGVWSLVLGQIASQVVTSLQYLRLTPLRPSLRRARWRTLRELARFGRHVTIGNLVGLVDGNVDTVVAGRILGAAGVGYYNLAWRLCNIPALGISYIIGRVMFPAYAALQDNVPAFREAFLTNLRRVALVSLPTGLVILIAAEPIVVGIFGQPWHPAVAPLRILAVFGLVRSFAGATGAVFQAAGRPQLVWLISVWHLVVLSGSLALLAGPYGVRGIAWAMLIAAISSAVPAYFFALRILDMGLRSLLGELARPASCSLPLVVGLAGGVAAFGGLAPVLELVSTLLLALVVYAATVALVGRSEIQMIAAAFRS